MAACCTVSKAPPKPASCSANLCKTIPGFCGDAEVVNDKRDLVHSHAASHAKLHALEKRGGEHTYRANLANGVVIRIIGLAYPGLVELFGLQPGLQILRRFFRLIPGYCLGPSIAESNVPPNVDQNALRGFESEHPIDVSTISTHRYMHTPPAKSDCRFLKHTYGFPTTG